MPKILTQTNNADFRDRLCEAAAGIFSELGHDVFNMRELARRWKRVRPWARPMCNSRCGNKPIDELVRELIVPPLVERRSGNHFNLILSQPRGDTAMKAITHAVLIATMCAATWFATSAAQAGIFNNPGNILIADQFNNRVIEIDRQGQIVWSFGRGPRDFTAKSVVGVNDAERVGRDTLIAGTGIPPGVDAFCKNTAGCPDNRVMLVDPNGKIVWQYGTFGPGGSGLDQLNTPVQATWTPTRTVFISDQANQRVIEVDHAKNIRWQYGQTGVAGAGFDQLNNPNSAELLDNGNILISDESNNRAIEVDRNKNIVKTFTAGGTLNGVAFASRLANGHTLITDANNSRIVDVDKNDNVVWQYLTNLEPGSNSSPAPTRAVQTQNGQIIISDQFNQRVLVIKKSTKQIIAQYGHLNHAGYGTTSTQEGLFAPYDAKVIGDFTGLTAPY